ncbi:MAG: hypothetical protein B7Z55_10760 [Planctomycetales bacterium 12-60-4]|nr:MAG: hypothetical protein B7Z55_10760 [Planctomycetales bacterium 12-60-4]
MGMGKPSADATWNDILWDGFSYAGPVMLILLCHEMGHFLTARWYGVPASPPFFLPLPLISPLGTLGAVIVQPRGFGDRRTMFDIAIAGPLAGIVIAIPVAWFGVQQAELMQYTASATSLTFGDPLLLKWMVWEKFGPLPANHDVLLNPLLFAGWAGIFLTGFNLVPIGQLDGGHIMYGLLGRHAHRVSQAFLLAGIAYMAYFNQWNYLLMVLLLLVVGIEHPPTTNDRRPLGWQRTLLGWATMSLFFVCFTPFPITITPPASEPAPIENPVLEPSDSDLQVRQSPMHQLNRNGKRKPPDFDREIEGLTSFDQSDEVQPAIMRFMNARAC